MRRQPTANRPAELRGVVRSVLATVTGVGLATTLVACGSADPGTPAATPSAVSSAEASPSPSPSGAPTSSAPAPSAGDDSDGGSDPILKGDRQVVISPQGSFESVVAVDDKGRLNL